MYLLNIWAQEQKRRRAKKVVEYYWSLKRNISKWSLKEDDFTSYFNPWVGRTFTDKKETWVQTVTKSIQISSAADQLDNFLPIKPCSEHIDENALKLFLLLKNKELCTQKDFNLKLIDLFCYNVSIELKLVMSLFSSFFFLSTNDTFFWSRDFCCIIPSHSFF